MFGTLQPELGRASGTHALGRDGGKHGVGRVAGTSALVAGKPEGTSALAQAVRSPVQERAACKELTEELTMPAARPVLIDLPAARCSLPRNFRKVFHTFPDNTGHHLLVPLGRQTNRPIRQRVKTPGSTKSVSVNDDRRRLHIVCGRITISKML